jgi:hypothetical protein
VHRIVQGLYTAKRCERPSSIPVGRPRGAKAQGLRYERALASSLPTAIHGQWFEFRDANGPGWCQTDLLLTVDDYVVVLESKYTWTAVGHSQVELLYKPVLQMALRKQVLGIVVCKVLTNGMNGIAVTGNLAEAIELSKTERVALHWLGKSELSLGTPLRRGEARHLVPVGVLD